MHKGYYNEAARRRTQKAIKIVNEIDSTSQFSEAAVHKTIPKWDELINLKTLRIKEWNSVQVLPQSSETFEVQCPPRNEQQPLMRLKCVFTHFSGPPILFGVTVKKKALPLYACQHMVETEKIMIVNNVSCFKGKVYLTIHSPDGLTIFKLKHEFLEPEPVNEADKPKRVLSSKEIIKLQVLANTERLINEPQFRKEQMQKRQKEILTLKRGLLVSPRSLSKSKDLQTSRQLAYQKDMQRLSQAKEIRHNLEIHREKTKSYQTLSTQCLGLKKEYESFMGSKQQKTQQEMRKLLRLMAVVAFVGQTNRECQNRRMGMDEAYRKHQAIRKAQKKFKGIAIQLNRIQPDKNQRQKMTLQYLTSLHAKMLHPRCSKKARDIVVDCFFRNRIGFSVNAAFNRAYEYRRMLRIIQRYFKTRNECQITMFRQYIVDKTQTLFEKHQDYIKLYSQFQDRDMFRNLSWQYLKDTSRNLKNVFGAYHHRLHQIEEMKQINRQIDEHNRTSLKKHQKEYLVVPKPPPPPVTRYFRDMAILKSMLRTWYEIELRKHMRRVKKAKEQREKELELERQRQRERKERQELQRLEREREEKQREQRERKQRKKAKKKKGTRKRQAQQSPQKEQS